MVATDNNCLRMKKIILVSVVSLLSLGLVWPLISGIYVRAKIRSMSERQASVEKYINLLGEPDQVYASKSEIPIDEFRSLFPEVTLGEHETYRMWSQEGFPYYWVLVITSEGQEREDIRAYVFVGWGI